MLGAWTPAEARPRARPAGAVRIDLAARSLPEAIDELASVAQVSIGTGAELPRLRTPKVRGAASVADALALILARSGYRARKVGDSAWRIEPAPRISYAPQPDPSDTTPGTTVATEPIVVTTTKQPLDLLTLPADVSLDELDANRRGDATQSSSQVAARIDGLSLTALGPGRNRLFLRGVADSAFNGESQSTVAIVLDDARITYSAPDPDLRLVDIDRVEVLKGPQGSLYGTGALGGVYRMVTHRPELDRVGFDLSGGVSAVEHGGLGWSTSAVVNLPIRTDRVALRVVGYQSVEPGWVDSGARTNANRTRVSGARATLGVKLGDWRLDLGWTAQWLNSRDSSYVYAAHSISRPSQQAEPHDNDLGHVSARLSGWLGDIDVTWSTGLTWHDVDEKLDATVGGEALGLAAPLLLNDDRHFRTVDSELRLRGGLGAAEWLLGLSYLDAGQQIDVTVVNAADSLTVDQDRRDSHDLAAFANLSLPVTGTLSVDLGGRLFHASIIEARQLAGGRDRLKRAKWGVTPDLALAWQVNPSRLIYLRYGGAFRQGGLDISASGAVDRLANDELGSLELGVRQRLSGGGLFQLAAWASRWDNIQSDTLADNGLIDTVTAGNGRILGVEASLKMRLGHGWQADLGGELTDSALVSSALGFSIKDNRLPVVPEYTVRAAMKRTFVVAGADAWIRLGARYIGPARVSFDPALDRSMGRYVDASAEMHLDTGRWRTTLAIQNLLDDKGNVFAMGNILRYRAMRQFTTQRPRSVSLSISTSF